MNENEVKAVALSVRSLTMDAIEKSGSGHPGLPMGAAELGALLYGEIMKHNPKNPKWKNRDRFALSAGHGCMLLYSMLHLSGYNVTMDDIKKERTIGSKCPGHPEYGHTEGVENTSGPLGQGVAMAVGMAIAETMLAARFNTAKHSIVDHYTYSLVGEGCLQEGVASEAASLAGHFKLGKLIVFYDENHVSIDGSTDITFTEDVGKRFEAYDWQVLKGSMYNPSEIMSLVAKAKACTDKPTLIMLKSIIGKGSPNEGTPAVHGAPLGKENIKKAKERLGLPVDKEFYVVPEAYAFFERRRKELEAEEEKWNETFSEWAKENPELEKQWDDFYAGRLKLEELGNLFSASDNSATRNSGSVALNAVADLHPYLVGGSADLLASNKTALKKGGVYSPENRGGRLINYGIREAAMASVAAGITLHGGLRAYCSTFLIFSDYMKGMIRVASLMKQPVLYIFTHDSIYVGADGPTHQPIETLASLRTIPGVEVLRPADAEETQAAWECAMRVSDHPVCFALSRQNLQGFDKADKEWRTSLEKYGAYVAKDTSGTPDITVFASGSEVSLAVSAAEKVKDKKIRIVSVMSLTRLNAAAKDVRKALRGGATRTVTAEAGIGVEWRGFVDREEDIFSIDRFGLSGFETDVAEALGFTEEKLVELLRK